MTFYLSTWALKYRFHFGHFVCVSANGYFFYYFFFRFHFIKHNHPTWASQLFKEIIKKKKKKPMSCGAFSSKPISYESIDFENMILHFCLTDWSFAVEKRCYETIVVDINHFQPNSPHPAPEPHTVSVVEQFFFFKYIIIMKKEISMKLYSI